MPDSAHLDILFRVWCWSYAKFSNHGVKEHHNLRNMDICKQELGKSCNQNNAILLGNVCTYTETLTTTYPCFDAIGHTHTTGMRAGKKEKCTISGVGMIGDTLRMLVHDAHKSGK